MFRQSNKYSYFILITLLLTIFISSCSKNKHKSLKEDQFVEVLADLMIIENLGISESERIILANKVFEKHKIDSVIFNETRRRHEENEKYWIKIYTKVKDRIQFKLDSLHTIQNHSDDINLKND
jgi:hypothetical protein